MSCKCHYRCRDVTQDYKEKLFMDFYTLGAHEQGTYLMGLMEIIPVQRRRHGNYTVPEESRRQSTIIYTVPDGSGNTVQVCSATFKGIFALGSKRLQVLQSKKKQGQTVYVDHRGNSAVGNKYSEDHCRMIRQHILSFPRNESHYNRKKSTKEYLSPDLNIHRLYKAFIETYPESDIKYRYYAKIFKKDFPHLSFRRPRQDTCNTCDRLRLLSKSDSQKKRYAAELELHQRKSQNAYDLLTLDTTVTTS